MKRVQFDKESLLLVISEVPTIKNKPYLKRCGLFFMI